MSVALMWTLAAASRGASSSSDMAMEYGSSPLEQAALQM
jgi:hypothetical protein